MAPSSRLRATWLSEMQLSSPIMGTAPAHGQSAPPLAIAGRDRLLDRIDAELDERVARPERLRVAPALVGVHVELGRGERVTNRRDGGQVELDVAPHLDLERPDPESLVVLECLVGHRTRLAVADDVSRGHVGRVPAKQFAAGSVEDLADQVPDRKIDSGARDVVAPQPRAALRGALGGERIEARERRAQFSPTAATIDSWVSP